MDTIGPMDTDHQLPDDWEQQLIRAYNTFTPEYEELGLREWTEKLHPRDRLGQWREVLAKLIRRNNERRATIGDQGTDHPGGTGMGGEVPAPGTGDRAGRIHQGRDRHRPLVNGRELKLGGVGKLPKHGREEAIQEDGGSTPPLYELDPSEAGTFRNQISKIKKTKNGAAVEVYDEEDYRKMRLFMNGDGTAGFALKGDEFISVYSLPEGPKGIGRHMTAAAISQGGRRGDAFDTVLPKIYGLEGMHPVARMPFSREYAPKGWDYNHFKKFNNGEPDVVFMSFDPEKIGVPYTPGSGEMIDDYDRGIEMAKEAARRKR